MQARAAGENWYKIASTTWMLRTKPTPLRGNGYREVFQQNKCRKGGSSSTLGLVHRSRKQDLLQHEGWCIDEEISFFINTAPPSWYESTLLLAMIFVRQRGNEFDPNKGKYIKITISFLSANSTAIVYEPTENNSFRWADRETVKPRGFMVISMTSPFHTTTGVDQESRIFFNTRIDA